MPDPALTGSEDLPEPDGSSGAAASRPPAASARRAPLAPSMRHA